MFVVAIAYAAHGDCPVTSAILATVAAPAVGLVFSVTAQLGRSTLDRVSDVVFVALTAVLVHFLHLSVLLALLVVGVLAVWWHRPRRKGMDGAGS
jgi:chromate transporter